MSVAFKEAVLSFLRNALFFCVSAIIVAILNAVPGWHLGFYSQPLVLALTAAQHVFDKWQYEKGGAVKMPF